MNKTLQNVRGDGLLLSRSQLDRDRRAWSYPLGAGRALTCAADPAALQDAVAAGVLGCGTVILGAADLCRKLLDEIVGRLDSGASLHEATRAVAREHRDVRKPIAGYGHPLDKPLDPPSQQKGGRRVSTAARV